MSGGVASFEHALPLAALVPIVLWAALTQVFWSRRRHLGFFWLLPALSGLLAFQITVEMLSELGRPELEGTPTLRLLATLPYVTEVFGACLFRHLALAGFGGLARGRRTSRSWLALNYGVGGLVAASLTLGVLLERLAADRAQALVGAFGWGLGLLTLWQLRGEIRGGRLTLARLLTHVHRVDLILIAIAMALYLSMETFEAGAPIVEATGDVLLGTMLALRAPRQVLRQCALIVGALFAAGLTMAGAGVVVARVESPALARLLAVGMVLGLAALLLGGRRVVDGLLFGSHRPADDVQTFLRGLPAELGTVECCRRALAWVCSRTPVRGAAILLFDGSEVVHGRLDLAPVRRVWPLADAAAALPRDPFGVFWLRTMIPDQTLDAARLQQALEEAEVVSVVPLVSPRRRWGDLFFAARTSGLGFAMDDPGSAEGFADHLALVLDSADLFARTVAVERSLAHAGKLAAIGETAARIAHEIRNPITAARSLAQQLAREPGSAFAAEHELILSELERVERQVAELLRFARRDDLRLDEIDLGALLRVTLDRLRPRVDRARLRLVVEVGDGLEVRGDPDKLGQIVVNLVENAIDALKEAPESGRWIEVHLVRCGGHAALRVADGGPGVPAEILPQLFEPFFTRKDHGTGLGLAIVKRTVEAHGGRINVARAAAAGLVFSIDLPLAPETRPRP